LVLLGFAPKCNLAHCPNFGVHHIQTAKIVCHYHNPVDSDIDDWIARGRIDKNYKSLFLSYSGKNKGWLRSTFSTIKERIF
jgi:hypothetical protein